MSKIEKVYNILLKNYGAQGWWPLINYNGNNPTKTGSINGYHSNDYNYPKNDDERFEICLGAILTHR